MSEWKKVKLGELYEVHNGLSKGRQFFGSGYPFLTFSTVFNNYFLPKELDSLVQSSEKEREACSIRKGDVFITRTSETMDELGMSSVALRDYPDATYNGFTKRLRPITDDVIPEYIGYYLRSPKFREKFMAFSTMTTRASLANGDLLGMEVELPTKEEQHCIASILSRYDSLIENYQKQIKLLEEAAQRLYKEWFVDLHFPGHENTKIVDGVPEGWEKKKVGEVCDTTSGGTPSRSKPDFYTGNILWVKTKELNDDFIFDTEEKITDDAIRKSSAKLIPSGSILMAMYGATIGKLGIATKELSCNQACCVFLLSEDDILRLYLYSWLLDNRMTLLSMGKGAAQPNLSQDMIKKLELMIPSSYLLTIFDSIVKPIYKEESYLSSQIHLLTEARDRLLPKLMSGEIAV